MGHIASSKLIIGIVYRISWSTPAPPLQQKPQRLSTQRKSVRSGMRGGTVDGVLFLIVHLEVVDLVAACVELKAVKDGGKEANDREADCVYVSLRLV